jgi:hypothetical protein
VSGPTDRPRPAGLHTTDGKRHPAVPQALRRHRLPRFWLALTLGSVLLGLGLVYWWERQLPRRIEAAATAGRLEECLRYSEQLTALSWLPGRSPLQQGRCRRERAAQLWRQEQWAAALGLQRQLAHSVAGTKEDRRRLNGWQEELRRTAAARFQAGDLNGALAALAPLGEDHRSDGQALGDDLRQTWERNRLQLERASRLARQSRWWEALDALNRIDHPWWQQRSTALRKTVQAGLGRLKGKDQEQDSHGGLPHTVPPQQLDALVQRRIAAGMEDWKAFEESCRELGGKVVEAGPESACQR